MRGYLEGDTSRPFVALATQAKEVVQYSVNGVMQFYGSTSANDVSHPERYQGDVGDLAAVIATVGRVVEGIFTTYPGESRFTFAYSGYETLEIMGATPNRTYQPYTPQFVDL